MAVTVTSYVSSDNYSGFRGGCKLFRVLKKKIAQPLAAAKCRFWSGSGEGNRGLQAAVQLADVVPSRNYYGRNN